MTDTCFGRLRELKMIVDLLSRGGGRHIHCLVSDSAGYSTHSRRDRIVETVGMELRAVMPWMLPSSGRQPVFGAPAGGRKHPIQIGGSAMAMQNKRSMIDTRCKELQPGWGPKEHDGELQMLYDALNDDESIESLVGCVWGPENAFRPNANRWDRMMQYDGIAVVTGSRVVFLKRRGINKLTTEMPLHALKSVDVDGEGEVTLTGRSYSEWRGAGNPGAFKMRDVQDGNARNFAGRVGELQAAPPPPATPAWSAASTGASTAPSPESRYADMGKEERVDAQWRERSTMWGRNDPSVPERLIAGLLNFITGENLTTYPGELRILKEVLEEGENIEYWMGGRWGDATEFTTLRGVAGRMAIGAVLSATTGVGGMGMGGRGLELGVHNGVVVATDRRVLMLNSGMVSKDVVEVSYQGLEVDYNEGLTCSGLKFSGSTDQDYAYYLDHNGKKDIRSRARPLFECVLRQVHAAANPAGA